GDEEIAEGGVVAVSANGESFVWAPNNYRVVSYVDGGWNVVDSLPNNAYICSDRVNPNVFYAYAEGAFYVSNDRGLTFTAKEKIANGPETAKIKAVPGEEGHVWVPGSTTGLWYTTDGGDSFTKVDGIKRSDVVGFGKAKEGADYLAIYAVCEIEGVNGVYRSDDMAKSWIRVNDDEHQYGSINYAITGDLRVYGRVFVGTNGRGVVYGELIDDEEKTTEVEGRNPNPSINYNRENGIGKGDGTDLGDVNCDGYVDVLDIATIKYGILHEEKIEEYITEQGMINADINADGIIDLKDLQLLKQYVLGGIDSFE
ncbi:MAG: cellulosome protein dockerin type I, partial [Clostridiales bacterium]|nr:cellulosome protein dockerin type I [Clostridiales bacterium]